jgi:hypothetical protein
MKEYVVLIIEDEVLLEVTSDCLEEANFWHDFFAEVVAVTDVIEVVVLNEKDDLPF